MICRFCKEPKMAMHTCHMCEYVPDNVFIGNVAFLKEAKDCLEELVDIVQGHLDDGDKLDSFTLQPAKAILAKFHTASEPAAKDK